MTPNTDAHTQLVGALNAVLNKKLEAIVDENRHLVGKGRLTDLHLDQYETIARKLGFPETADSIGNLIKAFGAAYIECLRNEQLIRVQERSYPERNLEDYLCLPGKLELIEAGLKMVDRQYETRAGILDIFAKDGKDKEVVIELKMGRYDNQKVITQIQKYINDKTDARLVFVAPYISSTVFWAFKKEADSGRIRFCRVEKAGSEYNIAYEDGSRIPSPKRICGKANAGKKEGRVIYDAFRIRKPRSCVLRRISGPEAQETLPASKDMAAAKALPAAPATHGAGLFGGEEIAPGTFHHVEGIGDVSKLPLYERVLLETMPREAFDRLRSAKIRTTDKAKKMLDELLLPEGMKAALGNCEILLEMHRQGLLHKLDKDMPLRSNIFEKYCGRKGYA